MQLLKLLVDNMDVHPPCFLPHYSDQTLPSRKKKSEPISYGWAPSSGFLLFLLLLLLLLLFPADSMVTFWWFLLSSKTIRENKNSCTISVGWGVSQIFAMWLTGRLLGKVWYQHHSMAFVSLLNHLKNNWLWWSITMWNGKHNKCGGEECVNNGLSPYAFCDLRIDGLFKIDDRTMLDDFAPSSLPVGKHWRGFWQYQYHVFTPAHFSLFGWDRKPLQLGAISTSHISQCPRGVHPIRTLEDERQYSLRLEVKKLLWNRKEGTMV